MSKMRKADFVWVGELYRNEIIKSTNTNKLCLTTDDDDGNWRAMMFGNAGIKEINYGA